MRLTLIAVALLLLPVSTLTAKDKIDTRVPVLRLHRDGPFWVCRCGTTALVKDVDVLRKLIAKRSKTLQVSETREGALLVLEVTGVSMVTKADSLGALVNSLNTLSGGLRALRPKENETNQVQVRHGTLSLMDYSTDVQGEGPYYLMKALESWVTTNTAQLTATAAEPTRIP